MKTMCPLGYHHNDFVATHALRHMIYSYIILAPMNLMTGKMSTQQAKLGA